MRGLFVRGYDPSAENDPSGGSREIGSFQGDAIRNITGGVGQTKGYYTEGAFYTKVIYGVEFPRGRFWGTSDAGFDASRVVPTADENRPKNINLLYCIKHD